MKRTGYNSVRSNDLVRSQKILSTWGENQKKGLYFSSTNQPKGMEKNFYFFTVPLRESKCKALLCMKLVFICTFLFCIQASGRVFSQEAKITLDLQNVKIGEVLRIIAHKSDYCFLYNNDLFPEGKRISVRAEKMTVPEIMKQMSANTGVYYQLLGNKLIALGYKKADIQKITGRVTDTVGHPLTGVTIRVKGTNIGTVTDQHGEFSIEAPNTAVLEVSYIGYEPETVALNGQQSITIRLNPSNTGLNQVVVVGYGTQKKASITGSISTLKGDNIAETPVANISSSLAGKLSGVSMRPNGGQPGMDNPDIHIRGISTTGNNAPLIVVDGVIRSNINEIDPHSIATVSVLKDAAAVAPYGLGGANGVILITTKKGATGAPVLSLNAYYGSQSPTYYPHMLNAQDYMRLHNEAYLNENPNGTQLPYSEDLINNYKKLNAEDPDKYPISNTRKLVKFHAPIQNYNLQLSGGTDVVKYYADLGFLQQDGMFDPVNYRRYDYNVSLDVEATHTTHVSLKLMGAVEKTKSVDAAINTQQLFRIGYKYIPIASVYYSNGLWGQYAGSSPVGDLKAGYLHNTNNTLLTTLSIEQDLPVKGLSIKGTFSYDPSQRLIKGWHTPFYFYAQDLSTTPPTYTKEISTSEGNAAAYTWLNEQYAKTQNFTYQAYLNYHNTFGKSDITGLVVAEARNNDSTGFQATRNNFAVNIDELSMGSSAKNDFDNSGSSETGSQIGLVYRVGYSYAGKYLLEASGRYDGHYYFAPGKRWGYFPAFSAGWVLSEENFIKSSLPFIDFLKLRGSWGKSGNLAGSAFQYLNGYNLYGNSYAYGNGTMVQGSFEPNEANPNITWEISTKSDVGLDVTLWNGLLTVGLDYFHEKRTGMLLPPAVTVPVEYGLALSDENAGIMSNHGFEVDLGSTHKFANGLQLGISGNFSYARNKMLQIFETSATKNNPNRSRTGRAFGTQFGYHALGLFSASEDKNGDGLINADDGYNVTQFGDLHPGDIKYADLSGPDGKPDGKIDSYDETVTGYPVYPFISYGFTPSASWKGFDLSLFFQGSAMASLNTIGFQTVPFNNNNSNSSYVYYNDHWSADNPNGKYPRANQSPYANNTQGSDFWMANTGYLRLKTAMLGYTLPSHITESLKIGAVRFYVSGQNVFTISKLKFMDPEVGYTDIETAYPTQKVYVFGLNVTF